MAEERVQRRLAAILAADVVGYSRLMEGDEEGTRAHLRNVHSELIDPRIASDGGRIVKTTGDGILVEFPSAVDAVRNALALQSAMAGHNADLPEDRRLVFRIGINLGDVIIEGEDIHGDGVNVAARLEGLCEPGEVYISGSVYEQVTGKTEATFDDRGDQSLKNISRPVRVYRVGEKSVPNIDRSGSTETLPLPDKPSIAVLPFDNLSGDLEQEYFADGIAEDIITALSRFNWFFVIARNSSFSYKGISPDVRKVAHELGVQYVLEGSVRKAVNKVRITAQLIDALTGRHVWAERYDRELDDIFAVQDEITEAIAAAVAPSFVSAEARRVERKPPESFSAWDHVIRGNWYLWRLGKENIAEARQQFRKGIELDPSSVIAHSGLAEAYSMEMLFGWADSSEQAAGEAFRAATRAIELDDTDASAHCALAFVHLLGRQHDAAIESCERALSLNPNLAQAEAVRGGVYCWTGDYDATIQHMGRSERLSPRDPILNFFGIARATAEFCASHYEKAAELAKKATETVPNSVIAWRMLASSLAHLGRDQDARAALNQLLRLAPDLTVDICRQTVPAKQSIHLEAYLDGLRKAGLPE